MRVWTRVCPDIINLGHIQKAIHDYAQKALQAPTKNAKEGAVPSQRNPRTRFLKPGKREPPNPKANYCTGWVEAFPIWSKKAMDVCMSLLKETIPLFGIPKSFQSDNRPFFVAKIIQELEKPHRPEGRAQEHNSSFVELSRVQIQPCDSSQCSSVAPHLLTVLRSKPWPLGPAQSGFTNHPSLTGCLFPTQTPFLWWFWAFRDSLNHKVASDVRTRIIIAVSFMMPK